MRGLDADTNGYMESETAASGRFAVIFALLLWLGLASGVFAQRSGVTPKELEGAGLDERLGDVIPTNLTFRDEEGGEARLSDFFDGERPVLLALVYHDCPMLCSLVLHGLTATLREMTWTPGEQFEVLTVSFNPRETFELARSVKEKHVAMLGRPEAGRGWHFLTGGTAAVDALTSSVGFEYNWVEAQQEFAHPSTLIFLDGNGRIARYLHGIEYDPGDVRAALVEASQGKIGSALDQVILYCFQYDPNSNSYVPHAINMMKLGGMLTLLALGSFLLVLWRREGLKVKEVA
jgi:protein SCO1/2